MPRLTLDPSAHIYRLDGEEVPSVTQLARLCVPDLDRSRPWLSREAAERGTRVHAACLSMDAGTEPEAREDEAGYIKAYGRFLRDFAPEWDGMEWSGWAVCGGVPFAGTADRFGSVRGRRAILDIKTGQLHGAALACQLTGYGEILTQRTGEQAAEYLALQLSRDGTYRLMRVRRNYPLLSLCMALHQRLKEEKTYLERI